jgi:uncharacterized membrane protein
MYSKTRLEALSDAIFAIVMTLLILDLKVPGGVAPGHLWEALRADSEGWLAFVITFFISARYWMLQHDVFHLTEKLHRHAVVTTFIFLGLITILPFSSALVGHHGSDPVALSLYGANQAAIGIALIVKMEYLRHHNRVVNSAQLRYLRGRLISLSGAMVTLAVFVWFVPMRYLLFIPILFAVIAHRVLPKKPVHAA